MVSFFCKWVHYSFRNIGLVFAGKNGQVWKLADNFWRISYFLHLFYVV